MVLSETSNLIARVERRLRYMEKSITNSLYSKYTRNNHLELGPGPNPFLHNKFTNVDFMDVNPSVLSTIKSNYNHPSFNLHNGSLLYKDNFPNKMYGSVSAMNVLHCIPNPNKWNLFMCNTHHVLREEGLLFGCYVNNSRTKASHILNKAGIFHNINDNLDMVHLSSKEYYHTILADTIGNCDVFVLKKKSSVSKHVLYNYHVLHHDSYLSQAA